MEKISCDRIVLGKKIEASCIILDVGICVYVMGGDQSHIGAATLIDIDGNEITNEIPGHRESAITKQWARILYEEGLKPVQVTAGVHYEKIKKEDIELIMQETQSLLQEILTHLGKSEQLAL